MVVKNRVVFSKRPKKKYVKKIEKDSLPGHIAIIPDGNGRWARGKGVPRNVGHREGSNVLKKIVECCDEIGIRYLTIYAFSTENWKRPQNEVDSLMSLIQEFLQEAEKGLSGRNVRIKVIGDILKLPKELQERIPKIIEITRGNTGLVLNIALNYGGRAEIISAIQQIVKEIEENKIKTDNINEKMVSDRLYTKNTPDPDLLIRTGGEKRLSNFLLWQSAYTEIWYSDVLWPEFTEDDLLEAVYDYQNRERRYGGI